MKITVNKAQFLTELQKTLPFVERKTTIPILANFLLVAEHDTLAVSGTNLEQFLTVSMDAAIATEGRCTIPAKKLTDCVKNLKTIEADTITITVKDKWAILSCGPLTVKIPGMAATNYPVTEKFPADSIMIPGSTLAGLIARTSYAIAQAESRYTMNGALLLVKSDRVRMVGTDGHRCAVVSHNGHYDVASEIRALIPTAALGHLATLAGKADVQVSFTETYIFFRSQNWAMVSRKLTGQYPNYEAIMPADYSKRVTLSGKAFKATLGHVAPFADERSKCIRVSFGDGVTLSASNTETGEASERMPADYSGDAVTLGLSAAYLGDILGTLGKDDTIEIRVRDEQSSVLFVPSGDEYDNKCVIMPMRI